VISDTHGYLDPAIEQYFEVCDEIWHLGDFGSADVAARLASIRPLKGVYGNIDGRDIRLQFPLEQRFVCEGLDVYMIHIGGAPPRYAPGLKAKLKANPPDILLCGHSHILRVMSDKTLGNMLYINPGAAGIQGFHKVRTVLRFEIDNGRPKNMEAIELGAKAAKR